MKLVLSNTLTHSTGTRDTTSDHLEQIIHIIGTAPLLVRDDVNLALHLGLLDQLAVGAHTALGERLRELVRDQGRRVQAR